MYMEAYGSVGNWADSIIKQAASSIIGEKVAKETLSKQGSSLSKSEGGSPKATPNTETIQPQANDINEELMASQKARKSLEKRIANFKAKVQYQNSLIKLQQKQLQKYQLREMVGVK
jgi:peptidoglycan hydrolase CwlO-like protein